MLAFVWAAFRFTCIRHGAFAIKSQIYEYGAGSGFVYTEMQHQTTICTGQLRENLPFETSRVIDCSCHSSPHSGTVTINRHKGMQANDPV